jgi:hypothetical protein
MVMGRDKSNIYRKSLHQQAYEKLKSMQAFGESRHEAKKDGTDKSRIFSYKTYQTYWQQTQYFIRWVQNTHPETTTLKKAKKHVNEWLQSLVEQGYSPWSVHTACAALCKLYGIDKDDPKRFRPPTRHRADIRRSRGVAARDKDFSVRNNYEIIEFVKATGTRRNVLQRIKGSDLWSSAQIAERIDVLLALPERTEAQDRELKMMQETMKLFPTYSWFLLHRRDKGGRQRLSPIIGPGAAAVVARMQATQPNERVWWSVPSGMDVHGYRADYATALYKAHARRIEDIPKDRINKGTGRLYSSQVYNCRKDERGKKLDKRAMLLVSKALGHNRLDVCSNFYLRNL